MGTLVLIGMNDPLHGPSLLLRVKEWAETGLWTRQPLESTPWGWRGRLARTGFSVAEQREFNRVPHRFSGAALRAVTAPDRGFSNVPLVRRCAMRIGIVARGPG